MKIAKLLYLVVVILGFSVSGRAADKWLSVRTKNFFLVGNASEGAMRKVGRNLEEFRSAFTTLFPGIGESSVSTTVLVFRDDASFRPYKPLYQGKPANVAGYFQAGADINYIALTGDVQTPHVIFHEYVHSLTKDGKLPLPPWVSEGLAEYYSTLETQGGGKDVLVGKFIEEHIVTLNQLSLIPLETLVSVQHDSPFYNEGTKQGIFYAESWALVHYFMLATENGRKGQLSRFLQLLADGKSTDDSFRGAFQADYSVIEKELRNYMQGRLAWPLLRFKLFDKLDFDKDMKTTALTEASAQFYLGDLLLHTNRVEDAETRFQQSIALDPDLSASHAAMGLLRAQQRRPDEALKFLTRAVSLDSGNYLTHYYYARMLQEQIADPDSDARVERFRLMRTHLGRAIELAPHYIEAYRLLGYVSLILGEELSETEVLLKKAVSAAPNRQDLVLYLVEVMIKNNELLTARALLPPLLNSADVPVRGRAEDLNSFIASRLESERALREYEERRRTALSAANDDVDSDDSDDDADLDSGIPAVPDTSSVITPDRPGTGRTLAPRTSGPQLEGVLTMIDCSRGVTLRVQVGIGVVQFHTDDPSKIQFNSNVASVKDSIACGPLKPPVGVRVNYRRTADPQYLGEPIDVLFIEKN